MRRNADFFGMYFEDGPEFTAYLQDMSRSRTWGDELTLTLTRTLALYANANPNPSTWGDELTLTLTVSLALRER